MERALNSRVLVTLRATRWLIAIVGGTLVLLTIVAGAGSRTDTLRQLLISTLADRLDSEVELQSFSVDTFPTVHITGTGLTIRHKGRRDVPPLVISISAAPSGDAAPRSARGAATRRNVASGFRSLSAATAGA